MSYINNKKGSHSTSCTKEKHQSITKEHKQPKKEKKKIVLLTNAHTR